MNNPAYQPTQTVYLEAVSNSPHLKMVCGQRITATDMQSAMRAITEALNAADAPRHVLVDLRTNPQFPLQSTILETLRGPFQHPRMGCWLFYGANSQATIIGKVLSDLTNKKDCIHWFRNEDQALAKLAQIA